jgi:Tfp pilus assembly protein PilW
MLARPRRFAQRPGRARGFSLVELMVSVLIGMIVVAGAIVLIVAIDRSNSETIQATRIHQELRALSSVVAGEIQRARRLHDPVAAVGQGAPAHAAFDWVDTSTAGCIVYGYQDTPLSDGAVNSEYVNYYRAIYLTTSGSVGAIKFAELEMTKTEMDAAKAAGTWTTDPSVLALKCTDALNTAAGATVYTLTSNQIDVDQLAFACVTTTGASVTVATVKSPSCNEIDVSMTARLRAGDTYTKAIQHQYVQQVYIRSGAVKTS